MHFGEVSGVAVNSQEHVFNFQPQQRRFGPAYGPPRRSYWNSVRTGSSCGRWARACMRGPTRTTFAMDKDDNIWAIDKGSDMIIALIRRGA